jgi:hypothetical protein
VVVVDGGWWMVVVVDGGGLWFLGVLELGEGETRQEKSKRWGE